VLNAAPGSRPLVDQLRDTLEYAVSRIPWYRQRASAYSRPVENRADLATLPIIDRATVLADPSAFTATEEWPSSIIYSSSTTGGVGRPRWRNAAELRAWVEVLASQPEPTGTTLAIHPFDQGPPILPPGVSNRLYVGMLVPWHFELIHDLLAHGWSSPAGPRHITTVDCFSPGLRILTEWLEQRAIDPREFGVERLVGYGSLQPQPWRDRLRSAWGATYLDLYGTTDIILSEAVQCPLCHAYHFPHPVIVEVVDGVTRQPITEGTGVLLLSELYPFAQMQVLVRYWTDDLVEIAKPCPLGGFGLLLRGRYATSAVVARVEREPLLVGALQVAEACADLADVALATIGWAPWAIDVGLPRFSLRSHGSELSVTVELRYSPSLFPAPAAHARDVLADRLLASVTGLAEAVADGEVALAVHTVGPGRLTEPTTL